MHLPPIYELGYHSVFYLCLLYITSMGVFQYYKIHVKKERFKKSFVPLGAAAVVGGFILQIINQIDAFDAIARAGDISPALVAEGIKMSLSYPVLGLLSLGMAYLIKYINQT